MTRVRYAAATGKAFLAYSLFRLVGCFGGLGLWQWLLPSVGDWIFRSDHGRLSSLASFIDAERHRRDKTAGQIEGEMAA
jgi:hypothetical protein